MNLTSGRVLAVMRVVLSSTGKKKMRKVSSQPFRGCWTSTVMISPLLKGSMVGLDPPGWWATRALVVLPAGGRERLPWGDGAGETTHETLH
ncbi:hypothetical protein EYF80_042976 [Liparis tanakae]|uniref:Uncharacterized protein n=1 Tax=Liparis tanakae TaxID=230148 RepID=A0A4Z2FZS6_9TELE|nr:hypothetical protein EYF80_042976 [Liparis tanakae]